MADSERDLALLWDIVDAARLILSFVEGRSFADYRRDPMLRGAVERHLEIVGVAAGRLSLEFRENCADIPWKRIIGLRNILAHEYAELRHDLVWAVATQHIAELAARLVPLLGPHAPPENPPGAAKSD